MDGSVSIRVAGEADFDALTDVWERSVRPSHPFWSDEEIEDQRPRIRDLLLPSMDVWAAIVDGEPVGFLGARDSHVELLYLAPEAQGSGIGPALLSHVAGGAGPSSVEVYADNVAGVAFYRSQGFFVGRRYAVDIAGGTFDILRLHREDR